MAYITVNGRQRRTNQDLLVKQLPPT